MGFTSSAQVAGNAVRSTLGTPQQRRFVGQDNRLVGKDSAKIPARTRTAMVQCTGIKWVFAPEWADARGAFAMDAAAASTPQAGLATARASESRWRGYCLSQPR
jgi:hypothetical protein